MIKGNQLRYVTVKSLTVQKLKLQRNAWDTRKVHRFSKKETGIHKLTTDCPAWFNAIKK